MRIQNIIINVIKNVNINVDKNTVAENITYKTQKRSNCLFKSMCEHIIHYILCKDLNS